MKLPMSSSEDAIWRSNRSRLPRRWSFFNWSNRWRANLTVLLRCFSFVRYLLARFSAEVRITSLRSMSRYPSSFLICMAIPSGTDIFVKISSFEPASFRSFLTSKISGTILFTRLSSIPRRWLRNWSGESIASSANVLKSFKEMLWRDLAFSSASINLLRTSESWTNTWMFPFSLLNSGRRNANLLSI